VVAIVDEVTMRDAAGPESKRDQSSEITEAAKSEI